MYKLFNILMVLFLGLSVIMTACVNNKQPEAPRQLSREKTSGKEILEEKVPDASSRDNIKNKFLELGFHVFEPFETKYTDFELEDLDGKKVKLSDFDGTVMFLNFWATWCGPCREEMPSMEKLYQKMKNRDFVMLAIDLKERPADVKKFMKAYNLNFPVLLDKSGEVGDIYGARSIPTTYVFDKFGFVVAGSIGSRKWDNQEHEELITFLLDEKVE